MNIVSIMAHQDDEMQCLGTLLKCRARGDRLFFVTLTDGAKGFVQQPDIDATEAARIRHAEMSDLARQLDAGYISLREPDEFLYDTPEIRMKLIEAIRQTEAGLIFTHYHEDYNLDHVTTSSLAASTFRDGKKLGMANGAKTIRQMQRKNIHLAGICRGRSSMRNGVQIELIRFVNGQSQNGILRHLEGAFMLRQEVNLKRIQWSGSIGSFSINDIQ